MSAVHLRRSPVVYYERYELVQHLGKGAFGEVELVLDLEAPSLRLLAMKTARSISSTDIEKALYEAKVMNAIVTKNGHHKNIVRYAGEQRLQHSFAILMEYCEGGELTQQIVPHKGIASPALAQNYFGQLLQGVSFLHCQGVAHRDIKPENLFLTKKGCMKLGDFGLSTVFRTSYGTRRLSTVCGTPTFMSPQVLAANYRAEPADIWSCGIVLIELLTGDLPWQWASEEDERYFAWKNNEVSPTTDELWRRISGNAKSLLTQVLAVNEDKRATIREIYQHHSMMNLRPPENKKYRLHKFLLYSEDGTNHS